MVIALNKIYGSFYVTIIFFYDYQGKYGGERDRKR